MHRLDLHLVQASSGGTSTMLRMIRLFGDICQAIFCHIDFLDVSLLANHIIIGSSVFVLRIKVLC